MTREKDTAIPIHAYCPAIEGRSQGLWWSFTGERLISSTWSLTMGVLAKTEYSLKTLGDQACAGRGLLTSCGGSIGRKTEASGWAQGGQYCPCEGNTVELWHQPDPRRKPSTVWSFNARTTPSQYALNKGRVGSSPTGGNHKAFWQQLGLKQGFFFCPSFRF